MLASEDHYPLLQVVLTTDKKMFTDRNKEDTNIEQKYVSPCAVPPTEELLPCSLLLLTFNPARAGNATAS